MRFPAEMLERIRRRDAANPRADLRRRAVRQTLQVSAAVRITNTGGIGNPLRRDGRDVDAPGVVEDRRSVLAARDDQCPGALQDLVLAEAGLLANQLEFVVVAD